MSYQHYKFGLILTALVFAASCAGERASGTTAKETGNGALLNTVSVPSPTVTPVVEPTAPELDVPYVPTHQSIVDEMLKMAEVKAGDVLYDLGSGDGRIPITAAQRFGTRGVGIDIDPQRIKEANENAQKAGVTDKVKFIEGDIFKEDFSQATVLTLYLLPDVNMKLRPKILDMKPGTRVVSHNYHMGDWEAEKTKEMKTPDGQLHYIYFWRVPKKK